MPAPRTASLAQCLSSYSRSSPTSTAPPYITVATYGVVFGHQRFVSPVTAVAAAKAAIVWPDGSDEKSLPFLKPRRNSKSFALVSATS